MKGSNRVDRRVERGTVGMVRRDRLRREEIFRLTWKIMYFGGEKVAIFLTIFTFSP